MSDLAERSIGGIELRAVACLLRHQLPQIRSVVEAQLACRLHWQPQELLLMLLLLLLRLRLLL